MSSIHPVDIGKSIGHTIENLLMGMAVICTVLGLLFGTDPLTFLSMVIMMSICMGGIPIIALVIFSLIVGSVVNRLIFRNKAPVEISNDQSALTDYIASAQDNGVSRDDITRNLMENGGWSQEEVDNAFDLLDAAKRSQEIKNLPSKPDVSSSQP